MTERMVFLTQWADATSRAMKLTRNQTDISALCRGETEIIRMMHDETKKEKEES